MGPTRRQLLQSLGAAAVVSLSRKPRPEEPPIMTVTEEQRHFDALSSIEANIRGTGMVARAELLRVEKELHAEAPVPVASGYDPNKIDWEKPPATPPAAHGVVLENEILNRFTLGAFEDCGLVNCYVLGLTSQLPATGSVSVVRADGTGIKRFFMTDCLVEVEAPDLRWADGVRFRDGVMLRVDVRGTVDGFGWYAPGGACNNEQIDCTVDELSWFAVDPAHSDGTHNDGTQVHSPIEHGLVKGGDYNVGTNGTGGFLMNTGTITDLVVTEAAFHGGKSLAGGAGVNIGSGVTAVTKSAITHNLFDTPKNAYCPTALRGGVVLRGNTRLDGTPWNTW